MKVSIVIPTHNHWHLTHALLLDILQYNAEVNEILIVDDASTEDVDAMYNSIAWWKEQLPQVKVLQISKNKGFLKACNIGVKKADGDIIILVSNDVRIQGDVVELSRNLFEPNPKLIVGGIIYTESTGWNEFKKGKKKVVFPYLEGWLLIFTKSAWNELGGFDENLAPCDFEDVDISTKAISCGYSLKPINNPKIRHLGGQTLGYGPERLEITRRNRKYFAEKWNVEYTEV